MILLLAISLWLLLGLLGSHIGHNGLNNKYPRVRVDKWGPAEYFCAITGPINLVVCLCMYGLALEDKSK